MGQTRVNPATMQHNYSFMQSIAKAIGETLAPARLDKRLRRRRRSEPHCGPVTIGKDSSARERMRAMARFGRQE